MDPQDLRVGATVKAGQLLLLTAGRYSSFGITGLFRARQDFVVPGTPSPYAPREPCADTAAITANPAWVEEVAYAEIWRDD
jgi:hypothetical protein